MNPCYFHKSLDRLIIGTFLLGLLVIAISLTIITQQKQEYRQHAAGLGFVTRNGRHLLLNKKLYIFVGINRYDLLTVNTPSYYGCGNSWSDTQLSTWFVELSAMHVNAIRLWLFQSFTHSGQDLDQFNKILTIANSYNIKVIPVFENQWSDCTQGGYKYDIWYQSSFQQPYGTYPISYETYVKNVVTTYKDDPRILMWQLMNEAESENTADVSNPQALQHFVQVMVQDIKGGNGITGIDTNHLLSIGTIGAGQPGTEGTNYRTLYSNPGVDVLEYHDYNPEMGDTSPIPSSLAQRISDSIALNKPIFIGEAGIKSHNCSGKDCYTLQDRANIFDNKMNAFLIKNPGSGYLIWSYRSPGPLESYDFNLSDPLATIVKKYAPPSPTPTFAPSRTPLLS
jgi:mannan endo-1,4-beta-mannosidase